LLSKSIIIVCVTLVVMTAKRGSSIKISHGKEVLFVGKYPIRNRAKNPCTYVCKGCGVSFDEKHAYLEHKRWCYPYNPPAGIPKYFKQFIKVT